MKFARTGVAAISFLLFSDAGCDSAMKEDGFVIDGGVLDDEAPVIDAAAMPDLRAGPPLMDLRSSGDCGNAPGFEAPPDAAAPHGCSPADGGAEVLCVSGEPPQFEELFFTASLPLGDQWDYNAVVTEITGATLIWTNASHDPTGWLIRLGPSCSGGSLADHAQGSFVLTGSAWINRVPHVPVKHTLYFWVQAGRVTTLVM